MQIIFDDKDLEELIKQVQEIYSQSKVYEGSRHCI